MMEIAFVYVTTEDQEEAARIAHALLDERLIACGNILPRMTSVYRWEGAVQEDAEAVLLLKTRPELVERVAARVEELHSYDCPCVVTWNAAPGNPAYVEWVHEETSDRQP
jgi:periplasmic divalent cation tolerance protein